MVFRCLGGVLVFGWCSSGVLVMFRTPPPDRTPVLVLFWWGCSGVLVEFWCSGVLVVFWWCSDDLVLMCSDLVQSDLF